MPLVFVSQPHINSMDVLIIAALAFVVIALSALVLWIILKIVIDTA